MGDVLSNILNNPVPKEVLDSDIKYLADYLRFEDICKLNYPEVLEEILRKIENPRFSDDLKSILRKVSTNDSSGNNKLSMKFKKVAAESAILLIILIYSLTGFPKIYSTNSNEDIKSALENNEIALSNSKYLTNSKEAIIGLAGRVSSPVSSSHAIDTAINDNQKRIVNKMALLSRSKSIIEYERSISLHQQKMDISEVMKKSKGKLRMKATAYDLSYKSCKKTREHPAYGITKSGTKAKAGRTIAVDPSVIPLGTRVYISFPEKYKHLSGIYVAEDTGSLIKGHSVDIFFGEDKPGELVIYNKANEFGIQQVDVYILD